MNNNKLLLIIAIAALGILTIVAVQVYRHDQSPETIGESLDEIIDSAHDGSKEFKEEIIDEIDDHTTDKR